MEHMSPTGRALTKPNFQQIPIHTKEGDNMRKIVMEHIAWTGGTSPRSLHDISEAEYQYALELFWDQCNIFHDYWGDGPNSNVVEIFWGRARHDAHATFRDNDYLLPYQRAAIHHMLARTNTWKYPLIY